MSVHTFPFLCAAINIWFLTDSTLYISDFWLMPIIAAAYTINSYFFYDRFGWVLYFFINWSDPSTYWSILLWIIGLTTLAFFSNSLTAYLTQVLIGRYEWNGSWLNTNFQ